MIPTLPNTKQYRSVEVQTRVTMLTVHIHEMPNECLTIVFQNLKLQRMILLRGVCCRWKNAIEAICRRKQSLIITNHFINFKPAQYYLPPMFNLEQDTFLKPIHFKHRLAIMNSAVSEEFCELLL